MLYAYDNGTRMEVVQASYITSYKRGNEWWYLLDNGVEVREDFPLCNQDIITCKYKERLAKRLVYLGCNYKQIVKNLKFV